MASIQHQRKEAMFFKAIANIISNEISNSAISDPTVTAVKLANDDGHLLVYLTFASHGEKSLAALKNAKGFIRSRLAKLPNLRHVPNLDFKIDDSLERSNRIEKILKEIKKNEK